jgi:hypothetical protein
MTTKSWTGWLVLVVSLSIPSVLFYQWHSRLDDACRQQESVKLRLASKPFPLSHEKVRLTSPIAAPPEPLAPGAAPVEKAPVIAAAPLPKPPALGGALAAALAALPQPVQQPVVAVKPFARWRDPTLSPFDIRRLEEIRIEQEIASTPLRPDAQPQAARRPKPRPSAEKAVELQGIIYIDEGNHSAIVNGETVQEGQVIKTPAGAVKVLSITAQQVQFSLQGRRFIKSVSK